MEEGLQRFALIVKQLAHLGDLVSQTCKPAQELHYALLFDRHRVRGGRVRSSVEEHDCTLANLLPEGQFGAQLQTVDGLARWNVAQRC